MRFINLFERWTRFQDKWPKHKSHILIFDGYAVMHMREFNVIKNSDAKSRGHNYFFWLIGCNIPGKDNEEDRYPLWMYVPKTKFKTRYNRVSDRIEAY